MQLRKFFVPATDVGVGRTFRHFAAMLLTLTVIGHLIKRHGHSFYKRQRYNAVSGALLENSDAADGAVAQFRLRSEQCREGSSVFANARTRLQI